jgi:hypothetical protein
MVGVAPQDESGALFDPGELRTDDEVLALEPRRVGAADRQVDALFALHIHDVSPAGRSTLSPCTAAHQNALRRDI